MMWTRLAVSWQQLKNWWNGLRWHLSQQEDDIELLDCDPETCRDEINPGTGYPMIDDIIDVHGNTYGRGEDVFCDDD